MFCVVTTSITYTHTVLLQYQAGECKHKVISFLLTLCCSLYLNDKIIQKNVRQLSLCTQHRMMTKTNVFFVARVDIDLVLPQWLFLSFDAIFTSNDAKELQDNREQMIGC